MVEGLLRAWVLGWVWGKRVSEEQCVDALSLALGRRLLPRAPRPPSTDFSSLPTQFLFFFSSGSV